MHERERALGVVAVLHVDPDEVPQLRGVPHDRAQVLVAELNVQVEAELRQLDRHVAVDPFGPDRVEHAEHLGRGPVGVLAGVDVFAQQVERGAHPRGVRG